MKPTLYIETTVISYLTARRSKDSIAAAHQRITKEWWDKALPLFEPFISPFVIEEISKGDEQAAKLRIEKVSSMPLLKISPEARRLADAYFSAVGLSEKARMDSYHLAMATWHGMDYLVSWNCTHIVSGRVRRIVEEVNAPFGLKTPILCTPEELMEV
jgi:predicted nucleic acid-binding protein